MESNSDDLSQSLTPNGSNRTKNKFTAWTDILIERELSDGICTQMSIKPINYDMNDRNCENYTIGDRNENWSAVTVQTKRKKLKRNKSAIKAIGNLKRRRFRRPTQTNTAADIAYKLKEPKINLIRRVVESVGETKALQLYAQTINIEESGGLMTCDGSRRRSSGGVFFHLLKNDSQISKQIIDSIFADEQQVIRKKKKRNRKNKKRKLLINPKDDTSETITKENSQNIEQDMKI